MENKVIIQIENAYLRDLPQLTKDKYGASGVDLMLDKALANELRSLGCSIKECQDGLFCRVKEFPKSLKEYEKLVKTITPARIFKISGKASGTSTLKVELYESNILGHRLITMHYVEL